MNVSVRMMHKPDRSLRRSILRFVGLSVLALTALFAVNSAVAATNTYVFNYANRTALLNAGWSFVAQTNGGPRNTEVTSTNVGGVIAYAQNNPTLGTVMRVPCDVDSLWGSPQAIPNAVPILQPNPIANQTRNSLFRPLPTNWISMEVSCSMVLDANYRGISLLYYQDDDNYFDLGWRYNSDLANVWGLSDPRSISLSREFYGFPHEVSAIALPATTISMRLVRDLATDNVSAYCSTNGGTNWIFVGQAPQVITNAQLGLIVCGSPATFPVGNLPNCDIRQAVIVTVDNYTNPPPILVVQPSQLVFNTVVGVANTATQRLNVVSRRGSSPLSWTVSTNASWLSASVSSGQTPGFCDITVNATGLSAGTYQGILTFNATEPTNTPLAVDVKFIVNPNNRVRVTTWHGSKVGAMTVSVDDSAITAFDMLNTNGLKGSYMMWHTTPPSQYNSYYLAGMELGLHTVDHPCFAINEPARRYEIETNYESLVRQVASVQRRDVISFAWPCGFRTIEEETVAADYFLIARGYNINQLEDPTPNDFMNVKSYNSHEHVPAPPADFKTLVDAAITQGKWYNMVLHSTNDENGAISYAAGKTNLWVGTLGGVTKYIIQRDRTVVTNYSETSGFLQFDSYRLPVPSTFARNFESSFLQTDTLTFKVNISGLSSIKSVSVNGQGKAFNISGPNLTFDAVITTNSQTILVSFGTNSPPVFSASIPSQTVNELALLRVTNSAVDVDVPSQFLSYALTVTRLSDGLVQTNAQIATNGVITWTPTEAQGPGDFQFRTIVSDSGAPSLSATNNFLVTVREVNLPPVLPAQTDRTIDVGSMLAVVNTASDPDLPANNLTYQLLTAPANATISENGVINWMPTSQQGATTNLVVTKVTDDSPLAVNTQNLSATNSFTVVVNAAPGATPPVIESIALTNGLIELLWTTTPGYTYRVQTTDSLYDGEWSDLPPDVLATGTTATATDDVVDSDARFYRIVLLQ